LKPGPHKIQGTGRALFPKKPSLKDGKGKQTRITEYIQVSNDDAFAMARRLAKEEGISPAFPRCEVWAAIEIARRPENKGKMIVTGLLDGRALLSAPRWPQEARAAVGG